MKARTHTELYRRFEGDRRGTRARFLPLLAAGVRTAAKSKLPLLILYGPAVIATVIFSFLVHGKYAGESLGRPASVIQAFTQTVARQVAASIQVAETIAEANHVMRFFALLAVTWYGSGAIAEDRRMGAHLLYFSRPLTRLDYFVAKFLQVAFFGALASVVPGLVICLVAAFSSPQWSFLRHEGEVIAQTIAYGAAWIGVTTSVVLCASSLCSRRTHALVAAFGFFVLNHGLGGVFGQADPRYQAISLINCLRLVRNELFDVADWRQLGFSLTTACLVLGGTVLACLSVVAWRIRRLEVVA